MNELFGYRIIDRRKCGFPDNALDKVLNKLNDKKISYQVLNINSKPIIKDFKKLNQYEKYFKESTKRMDRQNKINMIVDKIKNANPEKLEEIMEMLINV